MKTRIILSSLCLLLLSSCIVKSIQPFYTEGQQIENKDLVGNWTDQKKGEWRIVSFKDEWEKETDPNTKLTKEDLEAYELYKKAYYIQYTRKASEAAFIAMPFKVGEHLFIDLTPFEYESEDLNPLAAQHLLKTHSAAYVELNGKDVVLKWLSESAIGELINKNRLRIKHEKTGIDQDLILTASSEELHSFLEKFMVSDFDNKWDNDVIYKLKKQDAKP